MTDKLRINRYKKMINNRTNKWIINNKCNRNPNKYTRNNNKDKTCKKDKSNSYKEMR